MSAPLFDQSLHRLRQARAARIGGDLFLRTRAFDDCLDRLAGIDRTFASALILGMTGEHAADALRTHLPQPNVTTAKRAEVPQLSPGSFDLLVSIGELETSDDLASTAFVRRHLLAPGGLLLGAIVGGNSLPRLRSALLAADRVSGGAAPRLHPSIDGPSLSALLVSVGLLDPVVDVDRLDVSYPNLDRLVADLRSMGCTNVLLERSRRPFTRQQAAVAKAAFLGGEDRVRERFELLHFAAWAPSGIVTTTKLTVL